MTTKPVTIPVHATAQEAAVVMRQTNVRHLPVVDKNGSLVGILSDRDLRHFLTPHLRHESQAPITTSPLEMGVANIMSSNALAVNLNTDVSEIVDLLVKYKIGAIPVINARGLLVGIVSYIDVLRCVQRGNCWGIA